jgi:hypothetical protein
MSNIVALAPTSACSVGAGRPAAIAVLLSALVAAAPAAAADSFPRTPDGRPDFQGNWTNATLTPFERPRAAGSKLVMSAEEAAAMERDYARRMAGADAPTDLGKDLPPAADGVGGYNAFWIARGPHLLEVRGEKRTSIITHPDNGQLPAKVRPAYFGVLYGVQQTGGPFDGPEKRPAPERCLIGFGSTSGPPMLPVQYNSNYQIVQTGDHLMVLVEMVHDARIIRIGSERPAQAPPPRWLGNSHARWDGDTLVIETDGFHPQQPFYAASGARRVTEWLSPIDADSFAYRFEVVDDVAYTAPLRGELVFERSSEPLYEYACHEGNYALPGALAGARAAEGRDLAAEGTAIGPRH